MCVVVPDRLVRLGGQRLFCDPQWLPRSVPSPAASSAVAASNEHTLCPFDESLHSVVCAPTPAQGDDVGVVFPALVRANDNAQDHNVAEKARVLKP